MTECKDCLIEPVDPCLVPDTNPINRVGDCVGDDAGDGTKPPTTPPDNGNCIKTATGVMCPSQSGCAIWDLTDTTEECLISGYIEEQLNIAGTNLIVHKLLGIHEQGTLIDQTGTGAAIASSFLANNPPSYAFDKYITEWKSAEIGTAVLAKAYLGYDFGPIKLKNGRPRYGIETEIMKNVSTIRIMQGCEPENRATKVRLERSENGVKWYGAAIIALEDCDGLLTININSTVPSRYWRIRPISFNGGVNDSWVVRVLQLVDYEETNLYNIQDKILLENRDRDYQEKGITIRAAYTPQEYSTIMSPIGFNPIGDIYSFEVSFTHCIQKVGRPIVIGDILMLSAERQYTATLRPVDKYLEVVDVLWAATGFTPMWKPTLYKIIAKPLIASQETQDIAGKLTVNVDTSGVFDGNDGLRGKKYQDYMDISDNIRAHGKEAVPEKGIDYADVPILSKELRDYAAKNPKMNLDKFDRTRLPNGIDAMPPNQLPYTEGDAFPASPADGAYHRLTYKMLGDNIPVRLHRYSAAKGRWMYLETDRRAEINAHRPLLHDYTGRDSSKTPLGEIKDVMSK